MDEYLNKGKELLKILISNGYEAYFIGDVVRRIILTLPYDEIEINTSATPEAIKGIFNFTKCEDFGDGLIKVAYYGYDFYLSTFRITEKKDRKNVTTHYSKRLLDDLSCRDFTINAIAMSHSEKLTDAYNGYEDIRKKRIRTIGKNTAGYQQLPIRMLRAIRLVSDHRFKIDFSIRLAIRKYRKHLPEAPKTLLIQELQKLFKGKYYRQALEEMMTLKLYKFVPSLDKAFRFQDRHTYKALDFETFLLVAFLLNQQIDETYLPYVADLNRFKMIFQLASANPKSNYSSLDYFRNGLEVCLEANRINAYLRKAKKKHKKITKEYKALPIHQVCDLAFKGEDIIKLTKGESGPFVLELVDKIVAQILDGQIINDYDVLKVYAINELKTMQVDMSQEKVAYHYDAEQEAIPNPTLKKEMIELNQELDYTQLEKATNEEELSQTLQRQGQIIKDYTEHRLDMLERRLNEQDRLLKEKDLKMATLEKEARERRIQQDIEKLVQKNVDLLKESEFLNNPQKDKSELSRQLHKVYLDYIKNAEDKFNKNEDHS